MGVIDVVVMVVRCYCDGWVEGDLIEDNLVEDDLVEDGLVIMVGWGFWCGVG